MISKLKWEWEGLPHERKQTKGEQQKSYFGPHEVTREAEDRKEVGVMTSTFSSYGTPRRKRKFHGTAKFLEGIRLNVMK